MDLVEAIFLGMCPKCSESGREDPDHRYVKKSSVVHTSMLSALTIFRQQKVGVLTFTVDSCTSGHEGAVMHM